MANDGSGAAGAGGDGGNGGGGGDTPFYSTFTDQGVRDWTTAKGFKTPEALAQSALNLEKLIGADKAGRAVYLPKDEKDVDGLNAILTKLGRPEKADGYGIKAEGTDAPLIGKATEVFHKLGLTKAQATGLMGWVNEQNQELAKISENADTAFAAKSETEFGELRTEWGQEYDRNMEMSRRAARQFLPKEGGSDMLEKIERAIGTKETFRLFQSIGAGLGESSVDGGGGGTGGSATVEGARLRLSEIQKDQAYIKAWADGDQAKRKEIEDLNKIIAGGKA